MEWLKCSAIFVVGYIAGLITFIAIFVVYLAPVSANTPLAQLSVQQPTGLTYTEVCKPDTANLTQPQLDSYATRWIGHEFSGWHGWVHNVTTQADGTYDLEISMYGRGLFWRRDVVVENVAHHLVMQLSVEQPITFSGRITRVENTFGMMCNPLVVDNYVLIQ